MKQTIFPKEIIRFSLEGHYARCHPNGEKKDWLLLTGLNLWIGNTKTE